MHALGRRYLTGDQLKGVLKREREKQSPGTKPTQTGVGACSKNKLQGYVLGDKIRMHGMGK